MKKYIALVLAMLMLFSLTACGGNTTAGTTEGSTAATQGTTEAPEGTTAGNAQAQDVMTYDEYAAAAIDDAVCVEAYVQATQSWWDNKITVYTQDQDGGYFIYNMACSKEDSEKLVPGAKIKVTGFKADFSGEIEIADGTFEFVEGAEPFIAEPMDATALLGTDELLTHQNKKVSFSGMTVEASTDAEGNEVAFLYNWDGSGEAGGTSDLYFKASVGDETYTFVIEYYLCDESTDAYQAVQNLKVGDVIDMEGFLYWYEGPQSHITSVTVK